MAPTPPRVPRQARRCRGACPCTRAVGRGDPTPHLPADLAVDLIQRSVASYCDELGTVPSRVVIHKQSQFRRGTRDVCRCDRRRPDQERLVRSRRSPRTSDVRLVREGRYPPLRGTLARIEDRALLYSTGYLPNLGRYPHGHVPAPVESSTTTETPTPVASSRKFSRSPS